MNHDNLPSLLRFIPSLVTLSRPLLGIAAVTEAAQHHPISAMGIMALAWFTDIVDGPLARSLHTSSHSGETLDMIADDIALVCTLAIVEANSFSLPETVIGLAGVLYLIKVRYQAHQQRTSP